MRLILSILVLLVIPSLSSGQTISSGNNYNKIDCSIPRAPFATQFISPKENDVITWCVTSFNPDQLYSLSVDGESFALDTLCSSKSLICEALIPSNAITKLQIKTDHSLSINNSPPVTVRRVTCTDNGITYELGQPLPASVIGALRNQQGSFTVETLIGRLRSNGFHVEWQRVQFSLDNDGRNGYWFVLGWCASQ